MDEQLPKLSPTAFVAAVNQALEYAFSAVLVEGEVASFKTSQNKWVFFDLKDEETSVNCFMPVWDLRMPIEDGMKVVVRAVPKVTKWGRFSLTVRQIQPVGEGNLKKSFEMLKKKLVSEGLFAQARKRKLPENLARIGVISSTQAAGYADFIKIINARWGGMKIITAHTQVQGLDAPDQIIRALKYFNERGDVQVIAILRGGGSADDLSCFNDEELVRAIAASKIPVVTGIGHEVDESLADLAADVRASTPSNAAELLSHDRAAEIARVQGEIVHVNQVLLKRVESLREANYDKIERVAQSILNRCIEPLLRQTHDQLNRAWQKMYDKVERDLDRVRQKIKTLEIVNPEKVLSQGYAILKGKISPGSVVKITTLKNEIEAEIKKVKERK